MWRDSGTEFAHLDEIRIAACTIVLLPEMLRRGYSSESATGLYYLRKLLGEYHEVPCRLACRRHRGAGHSVIGRRHAGQGRPPVAVCGSQFNGFYLGGNVGAVAYTATRTDIDGTFIDNSDFSANKIGATAGVQAGYDWQFCNKLFGVVADWNWSDTKAGTQLDPNVGGFGRPQDIGARMNWFSTVRARAGLVVDNALFYVTGGLAIADIDSDYNRRLLLGPPTGTLLVQNSFSQTRYGFAAGAGTEVLLGSNWTLNAELLYLQFAQERHSLTVPLAIFGRPRPATSMRTTKLSSRASA